MNLRPFEGFLWIGYFDKLKSFFPGCQWTERPLQIFFCYTKLFDNLWNTCVLLKLFYRHILYLYIGISSYPIKILNLSSMISNAYILQQGLDNPSRPPKISSHKLASSHMSNILSPPYDCRLRLGNIYCASNEFNPCHLFCCYCCFSCLFPKIPQLMGPPMF